MVRELRAPVPPSPPLTGEGWDGGVPETAFRALSLDGNDFKPAEARRIAERLEIHYTPKHGSWLNMAEIEIGVLARQ